MMTIRRVLTGVALAVAISTAAACGSETTDLGEGVDSGVQGVPVPDEAEARGDLEDAWTVPDASFDGVVTWYEDQLPIEERYEDLAFCDTQEDEGITSWLWWDDDDEFSGDEPRPWLTVRIFDEDPTGISISYDPEDVSGACASG